MILCASPKDQFLSHKDEITKAITNVLNNGIYILGQEVKEFEKEFAEYIGVKNGIGVGSGTEALHLALRALSIGPGDEVITVSHTAVATVAAIELAGATPVFVDVERDYFTMDPTKLEEVITVKTKAIIPVHLYGQASEIELIRKVALKYNLKLIEDCSQAHGTEYANRKVGSFGNVGCFSFYPTKNLGAIGDGGIIVTDDSELAEKCKYLREYGWKERYISHYAGMNTRLDEIQAAILRIKLKYLDVDNTKRKLIAEKYNIRLNNTGNELPKVRENSGHVFHQYVIRTAERDELIAHLKNNNIAALIHYPKAVHMQPAYKKYANKKLEITERIIEEIVSLPIYPELTEAKINLVVNTIKDFIKIK